MMGENWAEGAWLDMLAAAPPLAELLEDAPDDR